MVDKKVEIEMNNELWRIVKNYDGLFRVERNDSVIVYAHEGDEFEMDILKTVVDKVLNRIKEELFIYK